MWKRILKSIITVVAIIVIGGIIYFLTMDFRWSDMKWISKLNTNDVQGSVLHFNTNNSNIRSIECGAVLNQPVVFLHGAPGSNRDFARYMFDHDLASVAYMKTIDRPGYGYSSYGQCVPSIIQQANLISKAIVDSSIIVGHSYGGPVAAALAMHHPEKVKELILLAPAVDPDSEKHFFINRIFNHPAFRWTMSKALKVALEEKLTHETHLAEMMTDWATITQPVTVVHGEKDNIVPFANMDFLKRMMVNADLEFHSPEDMNHIMIWTDYEWVKKLLLEKIVPVKAEKVN